MLRPDRRSSLDYEGEKANEWLRGSAGPVLIIAQALAGHETCPRCLVNGDGMLVILRGVNVNSDADPEEMVSMRVWLEADRTITLRHRKVIAIGELRQGAIAGSGPQTAGGFLEDLSSRMVVRMSNVLAHLDDGVDALEDEVLARESSGLRPKIGDLRRTTLAVRRYLGPQRDAIAHSQSEKVSGLTDTDRARLREVVERTTRHGEDLHSIRDRASVAQEELSGRLSEQMSRKMYVLAVVARVFLPRGLLTALLGVNVGGFPAQTALRASPLSAPWFPYLQASSSGFCVAWTGSGELLDLAGPIGALSSWHRWFG
jgi:zinc transporter